MFKTKISSFFEFSNFISPFFRHYKSNWFRLSDSSGVSAPLEWNKWRFSIFGFWNFGEYLNKEMSQNFDEFFKIENEVPEPWFPRYFHLWILCIFEIIFCWWFDRQRFSFCGQVKEIFQTDASSATPSANQIAALK